MSTPSSDDLRLLYRVAKLFYADRLSKTEISHEIRASATQVARLLDKAQKIGIARIELWPPVLEELSEQLRKKYSNLVDVRVVPSEDDSAAQVETLAKSTAEYFESNVADSSSVGLSGGFHVFNMVKALPDRERGIKLFPTAVLGRGFTILRHIDPIVNLNLLWSKSGLRNEGIHFVTVTPIEGQLTLSEIQRHNRKLCTNSKVKMLYDQMQTLDFIFASVGGTMGTPHELGDAAYAADLLDDTGTARAQLTRQEAVTDLNYCFIDENGHGRKGWNDLFLSPSLDVLRRMAADPKRRVVVTGGERKERGLRAALKGALLNVLITDERAARSLLAS